MSARILSWCLIFFFAIIVCEAQQKSTPADYRVVNRSLYFKDGENSALVIHLDSRPGAGIAWINGSSFSQGIIEFDEKGKDILQESFVGIAFHGENDTVYEAVYFRPFNFKSADPARKSHAVQYVAMPLYDWPRLRSEFPNQYEKPVIPEPDPNGWFHVKIEVTDNKIRVFVNQNEQPALEVTPLVKRNGGMVGFWVGNGSDGDWKNLSLSKK